jgi:hypothetical protein
MLGSLVLNGVGRQINGTDIVAIHNCSSTKRTMEFKQKLA